MFERGIAVDDVIHALDFGKVIEEYATDYPYPSALWLGFAGHIPLHVVVADNPAMGERIVATAYRPDPDQWYSEWTIRRMP